MTANRLLINLHWHPKARVHGCVLLPACYVIAAEP